MSKPAPSDIWFAYLSEEDGLRIERYSPGAITEVYVRGVDKIHGPFPADSQEAAEEIAREKLT